MMTARRTNEAIPSPHWMGRGLWSLDISWRPLPKGELRIARQFTAGFESEIAQVPYQGRLNPFMSYVSSYSHCVFSTKDRRPCLTAQLRDRLWPFLGGIAREHQMKALSIGGVEDHVHLLLSLPATMSVAKAHATPRPTSVRVANQIWSLQCECFAVG